MKARVVCGGCAAIGVLDGTYEDWFVRNAKDGPFERHPGEELLICPMFPPPNPVPGMRLMKCQDCGVVVTVSPSSAWLLR